jgi:hypothetical protein
MLHTLEHDEAHWNLGSTIMKGTEQHAKVCIHAIVKICMYVCTRANLSVDSSTPVVSPDIFSVVAYMLADHPVMMMMIIIILPVIDVARDTLQQYRRLTYAKHTAAAAANQWHSCHPVARCIVKSARKDLLQPLCQDR